MMNLFYDNSHDIVIPPKNNKKRELTLFTDYDCFVDKFKPKLTTDDCYTPAPVYDAVVSYVKSKINLDDLTIIRPFYPNGDFENFDYPNNSIVIDNPPFSLISKICKYYEENNIKYFLFAPHLTLFCIRKAKNFIVVSASVIYDNGAVVNTSFISNVFGEARIITASELYQSIKIINEANKVKLPKYVYPNNVLTVTRLDKLIKNNIDIEINSNDIYFINSLLSQRDLNKSIFGNGFLMSDLIAAEIKAAEIKAAEIKAAEIKAAEIKAAEKTIIWPLREREIDIINRLNDKSIIDNR